VLSLSRSEDSENEKYRGKLKGKSKVNIEQEETVVPVNLPNIPLPITTLPNFNFTLPPPTAHSSTIIANKEDTFTFASPIKITDAGKNLQSVNNFTFSNPIDSADNANNTTDSNSSLLMKTKESTESSMDFVTTSMPNFIWSTSSTAPRLKAKVKNSKDDAVTCELKSGSVMDILCPKNVESNLIEQSSSKSISETMSTDKTASIFVSSDTDDKSIHDTESFWDCNECLIKNIDVNAKQCMACKAARLNPDEKTPLPSISTTEKTVPESKIAKDSFGLQFKLFMTQWECTICCVKNKRTDAKCVACSAPKPKNSHKSIREMLEPQKPDLMEKFKPTEGSWECSGCLLRNGADVSKCPCCGESKPVSLKPKSKKTDIAAESSTQKLNLTGTEDTATQNATSNVSNIMNKFKPSKDSWECSGCLVRNNNSVTVCPCCNTTKPYSNEEKSKMEQTTNGFGDKFKKPEGAWNCDSCLLQNDAKHTQCIACEASKPGTMKSNEPTSNTISTMQFKFGVPSNTLGLTNQAGGFKFGIDKTDQPKSDTPLNGFKFGNAQPSGTAQFTFGVPKEENKATNEASKTNSITSSNDKENSSLLTMKNPEKSKSAKVCEQGQEMKYETSFSIPQNETSTMNQKSNTNTVLNVTTTTPLFTFKEEKSEFNKPVSNVISFATTVTENSKSAVATTIAVVTNSTAATIVTSSINPVPVSTTTILPSLPALENNVSNAKSTPVFLFGATSSISTIANNISTNTTACLPSFAQSSFTFSDSKAVSQPATIQTFGQIPISSATLSTKLFGENKIPTTTSSSSKPVSATLTGTFPVISSSTSLFNNKESKTTTAFGIDKPSTFIAANKSSGFAMSENKIPTFGSSNIETKSSIFGMPEATKLTGFNSPTQTSVENPLSNFGTPSSATPSLFGSSNTPVFGNSSTPTFGDTATTPILFSSTKPSETTNTASNPSLFTFGSSSQQPASGGFNFTANTNAAGSGTKSLFTFGNSATTSQNNNAFGSTFGTSSNAPTNTANFAFNPTKQEASTAFGHSTAAPIFGTSQATPQTRATSSFSSAPSSSGFNFGSTSSGVSSGGFNFGEMVNKK